MRTIVAIICFAIAPSLLSADSATTTTLGKIVETFAQLDAEWRLVSASDVSPTDLKRYEIELQKAAEVFFEIAATYQKTNPDLSEAVGVTGNLMVESAYAIFTGVESRRPGKKVLTDHGKKIEMLPNVFLGVITSLAPSSAKPEGYVSQEEIESLRQLLATKFGKKIVGDKSINGDNAFAKAASLTDGFLGALKK